MKRIDRIDKVRSKAWLIGRGGVYSQIYHHIIIINHHYHVPVGYSSVDMVDRERVRVVDSKRVCVLDSESFVCIHYVPVGYSSVAKDFVTCKYSSKNTSGSAFAATCTNTNAAARRTIGNSSITKRV